MVQVGDTRNSALLWQAGGRNATASRSRDGSQDLTREAWVRPHSTYRGLGAMNWAQELTRSPVMVSRISTCGKSSSEFWWPAPRHRHRESMSACVSAVRARAA